MTLNSLDTAKQALLEPAGLDTNALDQVMNQLAGGVDAADIYLQATRHESWSLEDGMVKEGSYGIDRGAGRRLQISQMTIAIGKARQQRRIEADALLRIDRQQVVFLVHQFAFGNAPDAIALLDPVVEASAAMDINLDAIERTAHLDRHACLGDGARGVDLHDAATQQMLRA